MNGELEYVTFNTGMGWLGLLGSAKGLLCATLPQSSDREARRLLGNRINDANWSPRRFEELTGRLRTYYNGHRADFPDELDLSAATPFQREVWKITRSIPYGETRSYAWVAEQIGKRKALRAVGNALGWNPLPVIVPCHRVLNSNGKLGGYSGGLEVKRWLLSQEVSAMIKKPITLSER